MADKKISQLTAATTPLAGTEVLPIVQSSTTVKVSVADVTKGRTIQSTGINDNNNNEVITITTTASAVNELTVANAATGANPVISATGSDTNIGITLTPKGTGNAVLTSGNLVVANNNGIDFSATSSGSGTMTSELFNDYEEGTWTATLTGTTTSPTTPVTSTASYTKIGRQINIYFQFLNADTTGASGNLRVTGLPFTPGSNGLGVTAVGSAIPSAYPAFQIISGSAVADMVQIYNGGNISIPSTTGVYIFASISYIV